MSGNLRACLFMLAAMAAFAVSDACTKLAVEDVPVPQIMAVRGLIATSLLLALAALRGTFRMRGAMADPVLYLRAFADVGTTVAYVFALVQMPIANASAIYQALPLAVTLGAALFFGQRVGWRRWAAIGVGFVGVLVIVRPGAEGFSGFSLLVLLSVVFSVVRDLATRRMSTTIPTFLISATTSAAITITGFLLTPFWGWAPLSGRHFAIFSLAAASLALGYVCIVESMRRSDMGVVAPFRYAILIFAIVLGYLIFGELPDTTTFVGSAIVIGSGIYSIHRDRARGRRPKIAPASTH